MNSLHRKYASLWVYISINHKTGPKNIQDYLFLHSISVMYSKRATNKKWIDAIDFNFVQPSSFQ
jgi:hypothetical protein